ncbi:60S ribosomal protein L26-2 [Glycine max]|uniref:60S ribosomal protein L26-2 n=1 Tax=Glycine soja TaxID=3848 RepID=A0A445KKL4_GLYSO|nr:60S ribosomal protein L26-2 [Glycine max]RZC11377.1 60S ribosomal protein L26-2 [Glycine soja]
MKFNPRVSLSPRKSHKAHFIVLLSVRYVLMRAPFSIDLQSKYNVWSILVHKDDKVNDSRSITASGSSALTTSPDHKSLLNRKAKGRAAAIKEKGTKFSPEDIKQSVY